jgi:two-component sensor histidine kinase
MHLHLKTRLLPAALLALAQVACLSLFSCGSDGKEAPKAENGLIDLRGWNFAKEGPVALSGEWLFAPQALLDSSSSEKYAPWQKRVVPDVWKDGDKELPGGRGAGTYKLTLLLPPNAPPLAIRNYVGIYAFELEVDGKLVKRAGLPSLDPKTARSAYAPGVTRVEARGERMALLLRTSSYEYRNGGIWRSFEIGDASRLERRRALDFYLSLAISFAIEALGLNYLLIFLFRRKEKTFFLFFLECLPLGLRPVVTGEYALGVLFPSIPFDLLVRLEYATAIVSVPFLFAFLISLFSEVADKAWIRRLALPFLPFIAAIVILPLYPLTKSIFIFYAVALLCLGVCLVFIVRAARKGIQGGAIVLTATIIILASAANYFFNLTRIILPTDLFQAALLLFVFSEALVLAGRLTKAFDAAESLSLELSAANEALRAEIARGDEARAELETSLAEKEMLLKEVHHRVKNSLQIVSSIVTLKTIDSKDPSVRHLTQAVKNRIRVISLVHERLYNVGSGDRIDVGEYAKDIIGLNLEYAEDGPPPVEARIDAVGVLADGGFCIDVGLILTELLSNAMRHAVLPAGGKIVVAVFEETSGDKKTLILSVEDEGPGFPSGFDPVKDGSLGFRIVRSLLTRRNGRIEILPQQAERSAGGARLGGRVRCDLPLD